MCVFWLRAIFIALTAKKSHFFFSRCNPRRCRNPRSHTLILSVSLFLYDFICHNRPQFATQYFLRFYNRAFGQRKFFPHFFIGRNFITVFYKIQPYFQRSRPVHAAFIALAQRCNPIFSYSYNLFIALRFLRKSKRPSITIFNGFDFSTFFEVLNRCFYLCVCSAVS